MYCGDLLYPAVPWTEAAAEGGTFTKDVDCAAIGGHITPTVTPPTFKPFQVLPDCHRFSQLIAGYFTVMLPCQPKLAPLT